MRCLSASPWVLLFVFNMAIAKPVVDIDPLNQARVTRGAHVFTNYCSGCHTLKYMRYSPMLTQFKLVQFSSSPAEISMLARDAIVWFGQVPPDLSLIAKTRGSIWLYEYLTSFYPDKHQAFGENNRLIPHVMMPNPFPIEDHIQSNLVVDLVTFLTYVSDPSVTVRHQLGPFVLIVCLVLLILVCYLKRLYWNKI